MDGFSHKIEAHYHKAGLYEAILAKLQQLGLDLNNIKRSDLKTVDEFHVRGAAVSIEMAELIQINGSKVLDVGCGLGGPGRMLAEDFDCQVVGIDLTQEYVDTAQKLSALVGLDHQTKFLQADATNLPFQDQSFDVVWTQHVQMNIQDKQQFYTEIARVLKEGGYFLYYDIFKKGEAPVGYPVPWANDAHLSFLFTPEDMKQILEQIGLQYDQSIDQTNQGIAFFEQLLSKLKENGPPKLGLNLLMGNQTLEKLSNLFNNLLVGSIQLQSGIFKKKI